MTRQAGSRNPPAALLALIMPYISPGDAGLLQADADLIKLGLDSAGVIGLLADVEDAFGIEFPGEAMNRATFRTPEALWSVVLGLLDRADGTSAMIPGNGGSM
jgi:acyl carrier protein